MKEDEESAEQWEAMAQNLEDLASKLRVAARDRRNLGAAIQELNDTLVIKCEIMPAEGQP